MGNNKKNVTLAVNMYLLIIHAELLLSPTFHAIYPALHLIFFFYFICFCFVQFSVIWVYVFGCNSLIFALLTDCLYISVTLLIRVTFVVSCKLLFKPFLLRSQLIQQM